MTVKTWMIGLAGLAVLAAVLYAAIGPGGGVFFDNPLVAVGAGLIGLGLTIDARRESLRGAR